MRMWHETQNKDGLWDMRNFCSLQCDDVYQVKILVHLDQFLKKLYLLAPQAQIVSKTELLQIYLAEIALGTLCCLMHIWKKKFTLSTNAVIHSERSIFIF